MRKLVFGAVAMPSFWFPPWHGWLDIPEHVDYLSFRPSPGILTAVGKNLGHFRHRVHGTR